MLETSEIILSAWERSNFLGYIWKHFLWLSYNISLVIFPSNLGHPWATRHQCSIYSWAKHWHVRSPNTEIPFRQRLIFPLWKHLDYFLERILRLLLSKTLKQVLKPCLFTKFSSHLPRLNKSRASHLELAGFWKILLDCFSGYLKCLKIRLYIQKTENKQF